MIGGTACSQWLTALTDESPTSSDSTHEAGPVTRVDKAKPKRLAYAAERAVLPGLLAWGWQLFRSSGQPRKEDPTEGCSTHADHDDSYLAYGATPCVRSPDLFRTAGAW